MKPINLLASFFVGLLLLEPPVLRIHESQLVDDPVGLEGERTLTTAVPVGGDVTLEVGLDVTSKGNGELSIGELRRRVYDDHDDGNRFLGRMLDVAFVDLNGDGYLDLVISGITVDTSEKTGETLAHDVVLEVFMYDPVSRKFESRFCRGADRLVY